MPEPAVVAIAYLVESRLECNHVQFVNRLAAMYVDRKEGS